MYKYLMCLLLIVGFAQAEIIQTDTIAEALQLIDEETWFIVDLDNTLFQGSLALGHVNWLQHEVQKKIAEGKTKKEAFYSLYPLWKKTQQGIGVIPVEDAFIEGISELQSRGIVVMGLTHRQLFVVEETFLHLSSIGVDFSITAPSDLTILLTGGEQPALYRRGVFFVDDFNAKGERLRALLQELGYKPKKIVFIDDKLKNIEELAEAASSEEIEYIGVHYTAVENGPQIYSPKLAEIQLQNLFGDYQMNQEYLYKVISPQDWQESLQNGLIKRSSLDQDFIHLAQEDQLLNVLGKFWKDQEYLILKLAKERLWGNLVYETNPGGSTYYYHLYEGNIPLDAVVDVGVQ